MEEGMKTKMVDIDRLVIPDWMRKEADNHKTTWDTVLDVIGGLVIVGFILASWSIAAIWVIS
jgi:hypothetical protein